MRKLTKYAFQLIALVCLSFACTPPRTTTTMWRDLDHSKELSKAKGNSSARATTHKTKKVAKKKAKSRVAHNRKN